MTQYHDINQNLVINLRDIGHVIRFLYEGKGSQKQILITLYEKGSITQQELTERLQIQPGSVSEVIKKLEKAQLIRRTPHDSDRRTTDIILTSKGYLQAKEALDQRKQRHQDMFSCLSDEEKQTLLKLTQKINDDWIIRYKDKSKMKKGRKE